MLINSYELEPLDYLDEQETFLRILYHDSRGGNAIRLCIDRDHGIKDVYASHFDISLSCKQLGNGYLEYFREIQ